MNTTERLSSPRGKPTNIAQPDAHCQIEEFLPRFDATGAHAAPIHHWRTDRDSADAKVRGLVRASIESLPEPHRSVLIAWDGFGMDGNLTASVLRVDASVMPRLLHEARMALCTLLDPHLRQPPTS